MKRPRLAWRRQPRELGLAGIVQGERGYQLRHQGKCLGGVYPIYLGFSRKRIGYHAYGRWEEYGVPYLNTCEEPVATVEEAKAILNKHFDTHLTTFLKKQKEAADV